MAKLTKLHILCHNANGIYNDRLTLQELLHSIDVCIALICETKFPKWFDWRNPGYRTYITSGPNLIHGDTTMLVKANIQHALIKIPMMITLQATAIMVELNGLKTVVGVVYQSSCKPFKEADSSDYPRARNSNSGMASMPNVLIGNLG
jgi:hypothetical protein